MGLKSTFASLALVAGAIAQNCALQFDGRVPAGSTPASFDLTTSPFSTKFIFGQSISSLRNHESQLTHPDLTMSKVVQLPAIAGSLVPTTPQLYHLTKLTSTVRHKHHPRRSNPLRSIHLRPLGNKHPNRLPPRRTPNRHQQRQRPLHLRRQNPTFLHPQR